MNDQYIFGSLTRISDIHTTPFDVTPFPKKQWNTGDYVVGKFASEWKFGCKQWVELATGRRRQLNMGELVVGALGVRKATLEAVGDWHIIGEDNVMQDICGSAMFGVETSKSSREPDSPSYIYQGHVVREGCKLNMDNFVSSSSTFIEEPLKLPCPLVLIIGSSMSCGKTVAAKIIIPALKGLGFGKIVGAKFTGAGFLHDIQCMQDAGADAAFDFVDVGLPSTVTSENNYRQSLRRLLTVLMSQKPACIVAEMGASPCEPYNGKVVLQEVEPDSVVLCASDPYAVLGLQHAVHTSIGLRLQPNVVTGITATTTAGIDMVHQLTSLPTMSLTTEESVEKLKEMLHDTLQSKRTPIPAIELATESQSGKPSKGF
jgi:hypothetical protein